MYGKYYDFLRSGYCVILESVNALSVHAKHTSHTRPQC